MTIELTYTAVHKARALSTTLAALTEAQTREWLVRAFAAASRRDDLPADQAVIYELPDDHLTSMGGRMCAIVRAGDVRPGQMVAVTIKALSSLVRAQRAKVEAADAEERKRAAREAEASREALAELEAEAMDAVKAPIHGIEKMTEIATAPVPSPNVGMVTSKERITPGNGGDNRGARTMRVLMAERKLTQDQVARIVGVTNQAISKIARGISLPSLPIAAAFESQLKIKMHWWLEAA